MCYIHSHSHIRISAIAFVSVIACFSGPVDAQDTTDFVVRFKAPFTTTASCGVDSLYLCLRSLGDDAITLRELDALIKPTASGASVASLGSAVASREIPFAVVSAKLSALKQWGWPAILHVNDDHFIALLAYEKNRLILYDSNIGVLDCGEHWFEDQYTWDGTALVVGGKPGIVSGVFRSKWVVLVFCILVVALMEIIVRR